MRIPPVKRFEQAFGHEGVRAYRLCKRAENCLEHPAVVQWAAQCYHDPRDNPASYKECLMLALNAALDGYGVEAIRGRDVDAYHGDIQAVYLNMGDTYATTIIIDHELDRLLITSYGDWVELYGESREVA